MTIMGEGSCGSVVDTPLDILKKRYAKGEIDKDEFERRKKDLES
jgi:putative membrane protein